MYTHPEKGTSYFMYKLPLDQGKLYSKASKEVQDNTRLLDRLSMDTDNQAKDKTCDRNRKSNRPGSCIDNMSCWPTQWTCTKTIKLVKELAEPTNQLISMCGTEERECTHVKCAFTHHPDMLFARRSNATKTVVVSHNHAEEYGHVHRCKHNHDQTAPHAFEGKDCSCHCFDESAGEDWLQKFFTDKLPMSDEAN